MNAKDVLSKIITMLSSEKEVTFTDAKSADGAILQSPTFDLGESVDVVSEDGTKSPAPDGEHEIALKDSEGKEVIIRVVVLLSVAIANMTMVCMVGMVALTLLGTLLHMLMHCCW